MKPYVKPYVIMEFRQDYTRIVRIELAESANRALDSACGLELFLYNVNQIQGTPGTFAAIPLESALEQYEGLTRACASRMHFYCAEGCFDGFRAIAVSMRHRNGGMTPLIGA